MSDWESAPNDGWEAAPLRRADPKIGQPEELSFGENLLSGVSLPSWMDKLIDRGARPLVQGMADYQVGGAQALANMLPNSTGIPQEVNRAISDQEKQYQATRASAGGEGADIVRGVGNVLNPVNILLSKGAGPLPATVKGRAGAGAIFGGVGGLLDPVYGAEEGGGFWNKKTAQVVGGVATGAALGPAFGYVLDKAARLLSRPIANPGEADAAISAALQDLGQTIHDVPPEQLQALREQVAASLNKGQVLDAASALRKADFDALDMPALSGQITRDPMQFAAEQNLRGVRGVGEPITAVLTEQGQKLQSRIPGGAQDAYPAGVQLSESLKNADELLRKHVSGLYGEARASAGKDLDVPLTGLAQDYAACPWRLCRQRADRHPPEVRGARAGSGDAVEPAQGLHDRGREHAPPDNQQERSRLVQQAG
jgi:hypothetical protein